MDFIVLSILVSLFGPQDLTKSVWQGTIQDAPLLIPAAAMLTPITLSIDLIDEFGDSFVEVINEDHR